MTQLEMFDAPVPPRAVPAPPPRLSPDRARTVRQAATLAAGYHPLGAMLGRPLPLHDEAAPVADRGADGRRCGSCWYHAVLPYRRHSYPKCLHPGARGGDEVEADGYPRVSHGAASDCRAWWPACVDHSYGDRVVGPDAARWTPGDGA